MDTFNDLFVTVGHSECSLANSASFGCWCGDCKKNKKLAVSCNSISTWYVVLIVGVDTGVERDEHQQYGMQTKQSAADPF